MNVIETVILAATAYALLWTMYLLVFPVLASVSKPRVLADQKKPDAEIPYIAAIVPGRNVAAVVEQCIDALKASDYPAEKMDIYVVADHCTDNTAERAQAAGASALIRDDGPKGKTFTLGWAFEVLKQRGITPDLYVVIDAPVCVATGFLSAFAKCWQEGAHIIANHTVVDASSQSWYARCLALMFVHRNFQNWSREQIKISGLLTGCGMAFSRAYIQQFGWSLALPKTQGSHPTEDWRHAVRAVEHGYRVAFADNARVSTPLRGSLSEATQQGARWERGRLLNAVTYAMRLLITGFCQHSPIKMFAALDAMQPPVAILVALCIAIAGFTYLVPSETYFLNVLRYLPIALVISYGTIVVLRGRQEGICLSTVLWAPIYVIWRCAAFVLAWAFFDRMELAGRGKPVGNLAGADSSMRSNREMSATKTLDNVARNAR
jgi:cellulose synthase/poly-beta-1,6-N-acetylglucosamine synthase-like glycosyltransferase